MRLAYPIPLYQALLSWDPGGGTDGRLDLEGKATAAATDTPSVSVTEVATLSKAVKQLSIFPDAVLTQTNLTGAVTDIDEDPDSPDANWMTSAGAVVLRVSFPTPGAVLMAGFPQEFRVRLRPGT